MSDLAKQIRGPIALPPPRVPLHVRPAVPGDLPFMDKLQKMHAKQVGWMPTKQLEEKINAGHVLIAETEGAPTGYVIGRDQYFKRDDVGIIYQMNVVPGCQRCLVGATLLQAMFARVAYGCRLFCCWCAQDIGANKFWEAMGFVPLAYRAGGRRHGGTKAHRHEAGSQAVEIPSVPSCLSASVPPCLPPAPTSSGSGGYAVETRRRRGGSRARRTAGRSGKTDWSCRSRRERTGAT